MQKLQCGRPVHCGLLFWNEGILQGGWVTCHNDRRMLLAYIQRFPATELRFFPEGVPRHSSAHSMDAVRKFCLV
jgi:hypothetical protein